MSGLRPPAGQIPAQPGVYRFRDAAGRVIYVGKARSLRQRLSSYFADPATLHPRTRSMVEAAATVDWVIVATEAEALSLEYSWIKEFDPRFNVKYRDDKSYPYLAITTGEDFPRAAVVREAKRKGSRYFGPYAHAWAIRDTLDQLVRVFPVRTCRDGVFRRAAQVGRPCLLGYIDRCAAPCVSRVTQDEYRQIVDDLCAFLAGATDGYLREVEGQMRDAAARMDYEDAARLRDRLGALTKALERNAVVFDDSTDADVIATSQDELNMGVQVFRVRGGRIRGEQGFVLEKSEDLTGAGYMSRVLQRVYAPESVWAPAREVLVSELPEDPEAWSVLLSSERGSKVAVRTPQRGDKRRLMETAVANAANTLRLHGMKRSSDLTARSKALGELQEYLGLPEAPLRIECIDISTLQGQDTVASLVVFEDGLPKKRDYRSFVIRTPGADDTAAVREVVARRFARLAPTLPAADDGPEMPVDGPVDGPVDEPSHEGQPAGFSYPPSLLVIDGGQPQVRAAQDALMDAGATDIAVVGLAKRLEEVWLPGDDFPVILPRTSEALYLLQRVRDEAHRRAIGLHRKRRGKRATASVLDDVPGLGPQRIKGILRHFGSVRALKAASPQEIQAVPGVGPSLAAAVHAAMHPGGPGTSPSGMMSS